MPFELAVVVPRFVNHSAVNVIGFFEYDSMQVSGRSALVVKYLVILDLLHIFGIPEFLPQPQSDTKGYRFGK